MPTYISTQVNTSRPESLYVDVAGRNRRLLRLSYRRDREERKWKVHQPDGSMGVRAGAGSGGGLFGGRRGTGYGQSRGLQVLVGSGGAREQQQRKIWEQPRRGGSEFAEVAGVAGPGGLAATCPATPMHVQKGRQLTAPSTPAPTVHATRTRGLRLRVHFLGDSLALLLHPARVDR